MTIDRLRSRFRSFILVWPLFCQLGFAQDSVLTQHNDNSRTGQNLDETALNTSNVNASNFGKLFFRTVDGQVYAQPLYVPNLTVQGKSRNVVYVATEHNSVYAFDADDPSATLPLWRVNLGPSVPSLDVCAGITGCSFHDLLPEMGITSTPVINPNSQTIYVVAKTKNSADSSYHFKLHALDLVSGAEKFGGPVEITASGFVPLNHLNRPGLLLLRGVVYLAFGSMADNPPWQGWVMAYDALSLQQLSTFNASPGSDGAGIFSSGQGLTTDGTYIYVFTGNGPFNVNTGGSDYGDTALKLSTPDLKVVDYFTPSNASFLGDNNIDLSGGGPLLMPGTNLLVGAGKDGWMRLLDTGNMGKFDPTFNHVLQEFTGLTTPVLGSPVYWQSPNFGPLIYLWGQGDYLKAWRFDAPTLQFNTTPVMTSTFKNATGWPNTAPLSVSANGQTAGTGIVWGSRPYSGLANPGPAPGILHAFDASNLRNELWNSKLAGARDDVGLYAKFAPPTVANGKVYLGTFSGQLLVYGLNPPPATAIQFVQAEAAALQTSASQVYVAYPSPQTAGDLNVVAVGWGDSASQIQSVTDTQGNAYILAVGPTVTSQLSQAIYYAKNIVGGTNTVMVNFNQPIPFPDVRILEYSNIETVDPLDVTASATGFGSLADSGAATTHAPNELIFGANTVQERTSGPGAVFTPRLTTSNFQIAEDRIVNVAGNYNASAPVQTGDWIMQMAAFKAKVQSSVSPGPKTFSLAVSPGSATVRAGGTASYTVTVSSQNGFTDSVSLSCSGTPVGAQCSLNPASTTPGNSATLTVTTTGLSASGTPGWQRALFGSFGLLLPAISLAGWGWAARYRRGPAVLALLVAGILAATVQLGCGGGGSSLPPAPIGVTPPGNYTITVTAVSGSNAASTPVTLTVQ